MSNYCNCFVFNKWVCTLFLCLVRNYLSSRYNYHSKLYLETQSHWIQAGIEPGTFRSWVAHSAIWATMLRYYLLDIFITFLPVTIRQGVDLDSVFLNFLQNFSLQLGNFFLGEAIRFCNHWNDVHLESNSIKCKFGAHSINHAAGCDQISNSGNKSSLQMVRYSNGI